MKINRKITLEIQEIHRAPDKMMDYIDGFLVIAYRHRLLYFKADGYLSAEGYDG